MPFDNVLTATLAIDCNMEEVIQSSLRIKLGSDATVITIAYRLETIMDSDAIIVLDAGRIVETGPPSLLFRKDESMFRALVDESHNAALCEMVGRSGDRQ